MCVNGAKQNSMLSGKNTRKYTVNIFGKLILFTEYFSNTYTRTLSILGYSIRTLHNIHKQTS